VKKIGEKNEKGDSKPTKKKKKEKSIIFRYF
jgi:hypothetical protein